MEDGVLTERRLRWVMMAAIAAAAILPYLNALACGFVFDDREVVSQAPRLHSLAGTWTVLSSDTWLGRQGIPSGLYRPLTSLSFEMNWVVAPDRPAVFHAVNILLHTAVCFALFFALESFGAGVSASLFTALIFAAHPLHTEAVTGIVGRAELLAALCFLCAWAVHLRSRATDLRRGILTASLFLLALLAKESAVTLLLLLPVADALRPGGGVTAQKRWSMARYLPLAAALVIFLVARRSAIGTWTQPPILPVDNPLAPLPAAERIAGAAMIFGRYLLLMIWPATLSADYSWHALELPSSLADPRALVPAMLAIGFAAACVLLRRREPVAALSGALLFLPFAVTSNVLFPIGTSMGERLAYLPSAGVCLIAGWLLSRLAGIRASFRRPAAARWAAVAVLLVVCGAEGARTFARNLDWVDDPALWEAAVRAVPRSARARFNLGIVRLAQGDEARAEQEYHAALAIYPSMPEAHNVIGEMHRRRGDLAAAEKEFLAEIEVQPSSTTAPFNLGLVALARGDQVSALRWFETAARNDPRNADAHFNAGVLLSRRGEARDAREHLLAAKRWNPSSVDVLYQLGVVEAGMGDLASARSDLGAALRLSPSHADALYNLGVVEASLGDLRAARGLYERALAIAPGDVAARLNLAAACLGLGDAACARSAAAAARAAGAELPPELEALIR